MKSTAVEQKKIFAQGICFYKLFLIFVIGSIFGVYYEQILTFVTNYIRYGTILWESRQGVIYGPFSPIYGAGAVLMTYVLASKQRKWYQTFLAGALLGGSFEYMVSFLQETFVGTVSWDYSKQFLNIHGRTTIPIMMAWGALSLFFVKIVYPFLSRQIEKIPYRFGKMMTLILVIYLSLDMLISWSALIRQTFRRNGFEPFTVVGEFFDRYFPDDFLKQYFPNMVPRD